MTFARYYKPACRVIAAGIEVVNLDDDGLRIAFDVSRTLQSTPDTCRLQIWGLSMERRHAIAEIHRLAGALPLEVFAGWDRVAKRIFSGQGTRVHASKTDDPGVPALTVEAGDGADGYSTAVLEFATYGITVAELVTLYAAPALVEPVPGLAAQTFPSSTVRVSPTALQTLAAAASSTVGSFDNGYAFSGTARELLDEICRTIGAKWWIADGVLEVMPANDALALPALLLTPATGLLLPDTGTTDLGDLAGRALLEPEAVPGRLVVAQDDAGAPIGEPVYRIETVRFLGDTDLGPWAMSFVARSGGFTAL